MAEDLQRLVVSLEAKITQFDNAMKRADGIANKRARAIETRFAKMNKNVSGGFSKIARGSLAVAGAGLSVRGFIELADAATRAENALKIAGLEGDQLKTVYDDLFASAQRNAVPFETLATLYGKVGLAQKELGVSTEQIAKFTDTVAVALRVSGRSAAESSGALLQLGQALGNGKVQAQEFNSILEGALPIAQAAAAGLKEAGGSVSKLRQLVVDGKISSQAFFAAIEAGSVMLQEKASKSTLTASQSFEIFRNSLIKAVGKIDDTIGVSAGLSSAFQSMAEGVTDFGDALEKEKSSVDSFYKTLADWYDWASRKVFGPPVIKSAGFLDGLSAIATKLPTVKPVSLADYAPPKEVGDGSSSVSGSNDFDDEMKRMRERTALLNAETAARARLNPLAADFQQQIDAAVYKERLLNEARAQGLEITPQVEKSINDMANSYAAASAAADQLAASQEEAQRRSQEMRELGRDVMGGFISDMRQGTSAAESLANALDKIADKMIDMALNELFSPTSGGGGLGGILGGLLGGGGGGLPFMAKGGVTRGPAIAGERSPEAVVPLPDGRNIPVQLKTPSVGATKKGGEVNLVLNIDARGATSEGADKLKTDLVPTIQRVVRTEVNQMFDRQARFARAGV